MAEHTKIEWCDHTFNPWEGCTKVSPGCKNCYAAARNRRFAGGENWGPGAPRRRTSEANWKQPLRWDREAAQAITRAIATGSPFPRRPRVFCASLADWLDYEVPVAWRVDLLTLIALTPNLDWLLLTKRPESWSARLHEAMGAGSNVAANWLNLRAPSNVWVGTTVEDQARAEERIPQLLAIPARVRFLSCEPLLEEVNLDFGAPRHRTFDSYHAEIHWVICGGESGPGARPMHPAWARSLRDQCAASGVPFFFKQWGEWFPGYRDDCFEFDCSHGVPEGFPSRFNVQAFPPEANGEYQEMGRIGKKAAGRTLDGVQHNAFPEVRHA